MRKLLVSIFIFLQGGLIYSQVNNNKLTFEVRYPVPAGNNFLNKINEKGYTGFIDIGFDFSILKLKNSALGIGMNSAFLRQFKSNVNLFTISPKIKYDYSIDLKNIRIIPGVSFGYSNWRLRSDATNYFDENGNYVQDRKYKENIDGLAIGGSIKISYADEKPLSWFYLIGYEFTKLEKRYGYKSDYMQNIDIIYLGVGLIWKFNNIIDEEN